MPDATGRPNKEGLKFYDQLIDYLLEKGIEPFVTLYHLNVHRLQQMRMVGGLTGV